VNGSVGTLGIDVSCIFFSELASNGNGEFGLIYVSDVAGSVVILNGLIGVRMDGFVTCLLVIGGFASEGLIGVRMDGFVACLLVIGGFAFEGLIGVRMDGFPICLLINCGTTFVILTLVVPLRGERGVVIGISHKNVICITFSKP
jgi:hypothetical protein